MRIARVGPTDVGLWGSMTAHQMLCHLRDSFGCPLGQRPATPAKKSRIPVPVFKWLALSFPRKWPKGVPTMPEIDQHIGGTRPAEFAADQAALLAKLDEFARSAGPWAPHPMFGAMTTAEWMRWGYLHSDHHLRQFGR
jgi:hypothetical protein